MQAEKRSNLFEADATPDGINAARAFIKRMLFTDTDVRLIKKGSRVTVFGTEDAAFIVEDARIEREAIQALNGE